MPDNKLTGEKQPLRLIATDMYLPGFPLIAEELNSGASGVLLTLTSFLVGLALGQLVIGPLSDRY